MKKIAALGLTLALAGCGATDDPAPAPQASTPVADASSTPAPSPAPAATVEAVETNTTEIRQADSHVHGAANLAMALDGNTLSVEWESPLYNLLGFEHEPDTDAQRASVADAEGALANPGQLFTFTPAAGCTAAPVAAVSLFGEAEHDHDEDHDHAHDDDHDHNDGHDHEHDDGHAEEHDHAEDGHDHDHADVLLSYSFTCTAPDALDWMETRLFGTFGSLEQVDLVYLGPATPVSETLTRGTGRISLGR